MCQPCNSSCVNKRCFGPNSTDCCNYLKNDTCVTDCGTNFAPNDAGVCECTNKFIGQNCSVCSLSCQNGGTVDSTCSYCMCLPGYTGNLCDTKIDGCNSNPCTNQGTCTRIGDGGFSCSCSPGYTGNQCENEINDCNSNPCMNQGNCTRISEAGFSCSCLSGYTGKQCQNEINGCDSNPCRNQGTCTRTGGGGFSCNCLSGYTGTLCDNEPVDFCDSSPCKNGGRCQNQDGSYVCVCQPGYTESTCDSPSDVCSNDETYCGETGNCVTMDYYPEPFGETLGLEPDKMNGPLSYCFCKLGAYGKQCNNSLTSCDDNPCGNRGDCSEGEGKAKCQCKDNWKGGICKDCDVKCIQGSVNEDCSECVCRGNWKGDSCSDCDDMIEDDNCVKDCTKESYQPTKDDQGQQWCFACAIFLCEKCNHNSVQETSKYECTTCIRGARMENGRCTTGPDTEDDTSDSNDTGLIVGLVLGVLALCALICIVAYYVYKRRHSAKTSGYYKTSTGVI